ncbi:MAG: carboxylesterase family protein [Syntrophobacteraceae bacterium]|nr:carboxylesterase family protein [Syntrophobacteraceae bacterium]
MDSTMPTLIARLMIALAVLFLAPAALFAAGIATGVVNLDSGPVRGTVESGLRVFLGIPYAAPPVGPLRFKPPAPPVRWKAVRECNAFGPACVQPGKTETKGYGEDCLYLNVWPPAKSPRAKLPVMVWVHGGGFQFGAASLPEYGGAHLARQGVVLVSLNYRLGPLGYFAHPLLAKESPHGVTGNYGLLDQIAALTWVRNNIAAFGGDPQKVTVFGQSAGARSVSLLLISPLAKGLFVRAIAQSGGPIMGSEYLSPSFNGDAANVARMGLELSRRLGCDKTPDELACLRAASVPDILKAAATETSIFRDGLFFAPVFDGWVLPLDPATAFAAGGQNRASLIAGSTQNEGAVYLKDQTAITMQTYRGFLKTRFAGDADAALEMFPVRCDAEVPRAIDFFVTVAVNAEPARFMARSLVAAGVPAYLYRFTRRPDTVMARKLGVHHGADLAYVFGNMSKADGYADADLALSRIMMAYWVNFAQSGDPNGPGLAVWPAYDAKTDQDLEIGDHIRSESGLYKKECDFIRGVSRFRTK